MYGKSALHYACAEGYGEAVDLLVRSGADVNARGEYGRTPLYAAARHGRAECVDALIECVDALIECVDALIRLGADHAIRDDAH